MNSASRTGASVPDQITVPAEILARYGVRLLDPTTAVRDSDGERPLSTAYRPDTILVPKRDISSLVPDPEVNHYDKALAGLGLAMRRWDHPEWNSIIESAHDDLGVPARLVRMEERDADRPPDAWTALVALRNWFADPGNLKRTGRRRPPRMGLDHLLMAAAEQGVPYTGGGSVQGTGGIALHTGDRNPVQVLMDAPVRMALEDLAIGRRPVIAVVDTGIGDHPWLPTTGDFVTGSQVVETSAEFQHWIAVHEENLVDASGASIVPLARPEEVRNEIQPLLGLTDTYSGHGTFVSGLVFQNCPDARILSLRMLHTDGYSTEGAFLLALEWLRQRAVAAAKDPDLWIDVVSLSLGFYPETTTPAKVTLVKEAIKRLTDLGVVVVAAAGNDATQRPFLPAAFGRDDDLVAAVGALNASGETIAAFSNAGPWLTRWAPGNALVSTVPIWQGSRGPGLAVPSDPVIEPVARTSPDDDDLKSGFAVWAGTSFATPVIAGKIGQVILDNPTLTSTLDPKQRAKDLLDKTDTVLHKVCRWPVREPVR
jgi:subtilisin family serine protease